MLFRSGTGFLISQDLIETNNISARGLIRTAVFQKNSINTIGGSMAVLDGDCLSVSMSSEN